MDKIYSIFIDPNVQYEVIKEELLRMGCYNYLELHGNKYRAPEKLFFYNTKTKERRNIFDEINKILIKQNIDAKIVIMQTEGRLWYGLELFDDS